MPHSNNIDSTWAGRLPRLSLLRDSSRNQLSSIQILGISGLTDTYPAENRTTTATAGSKLRLDSSLLVAAVDLNFKGSFPLIGIVSQEILVTRPERGRGREHGNLILGLN